MPISLRKFNAQVKDPETGDMIPAGLLSSDALGAINSAKTDAVAAVEGKQAVAEAAIELKGQTTIASIPDDYTALSNEVDDVKESIETLDETVFTGNTEETIYNGDWVELALANESLSFGTILSENKKYRFTLTFSGNPIRLSNVFTATSTSSTGIVDTLSFTGDSWTTGKTVEYIPSTSNIKYLRIVQYSAYTGGLSAKIKLEEIEIPKTTSFYSKAQTDDRIEDAIESLNSAIGYQTLLDYSDQTYAAHAGSDYAGDVYVIGTTIPANHDIKVEVGVYQNTSFYVGLVSKSTSKVLFAHTYSMTAGLNSVDLDYVPNEDCYLLLDRSSDKLFYGSGNNISYAMINGRSAFPAVGDTLSYTINKAANFRLSIYAYISSDRLNNGLIEANAKIDDAEDSISELENNVNEIIGYPYNSPSFDYDENATTTNDFCLNIPMPDNGVITELRFQTGSNSVSHEIYVYEWDGETISQTAFTRKATYVISVTNGVAECNIPVKKGDYIGIGMNHSSSETIAYWDSNKTGVGFIYKPTTSNIRLFANIYITMAFTLQVEGVVDTKVNEAVEEIEGIAMPLSGKIFLLAGDSRSSSDYTFYKSTMEKKTNGNALNVGASGRNAAYNASSAYFTVIANNPHDFSLWLVGGNDNGASGSVGTFSATSPLAEQGEDVVTEIPISDDYNGTKFIQAIDYIMRKYKSLYYDFKTLNNGHKPKMIFCTDLPQQRGNASNEYSKPANWERKRLAIIECCEKNNVACLDLLKLFNFDMSYEPYWTSPTDMVNDNGVYYMDGLHPNQYGCDIITSLEIEEMKKYIMINPYPAS